MHNRQSQSRKLFPVAGLILLLMFHFAQTPPVRAGGPMRVGGGLGRIGADAAFLLWTTIPVPYTTDGGNLGTLTTAQANARVAAAFGAWGAVPTSTISATRTGQITAGGGDIDTLAEYDALGCTGNPIIYDATGSLFNDLGMPLVLGFAGPTVQEPPGTIVCAQGMINGLYKDGINNPPSNPESSDSELNATLIHEFGHFLGLEHAQINVNCLTNPGSCPSDSDDAYGLPTMFPYAISGLTTGGQDPAETLAPDDIAWASRLYPDASYTANYGMITGVIYFSDGVTPAQGLNVIARAVDDPGTPGVNESRRIAVSVVSGYRFTGNPGQDVTSVLPDPLEDNTGGSSFGSRDTSWIGVFEIPVPAGTYTLEVESVDSSFTGGSSVGPLEEQIANPGVNEFWNDTESNSDNPATSTNIIVAAGGTYSGKDIILNGTGPRFDTLETSTNRNDSRATATPIGNGTISASISPYTSRDEDFYAFRATAGTVVTLEITAKRLGTPSPLDSVIQIQDSSGNTPNRCSSSSSTPPLTHICLNDDITGGVVRDSRLYFDPPSTGIYYVRVLDWFGMARPDFVYQLTVSGAGASPAPDLAMDKAHVGDFSVGVNATYTLTVSNVGTGSTTHAITVTDTLPAGLTYVSGTGAGWTCGAVGQNVTCTNPGPIAASGSSAITLTVNPTAAGAISNTATVNTQNDANAGNNSDSDPTIIESACSKDFDNTAANGLWQEPTNWNPDGLPGPTDNVCIGAGFTVTKSAAGGDSINSLTVDNAAGLFTLSGGTLSIAAASTIGASGFTHSNGTLGGPGTLTINGPFIWSGGFETGGGLTTANGGLSITSGVILDGRTLTNTAGGTMSGGGSLLIGNGGVFNNSGSFSIQGDGAIGGSVGGANTFNNSGTLTKSGGSFTSFIVSTFNHTGSVSVNSGTLQFNGGGSSSGSFAVNTVLTFGFGMDLNSGTTISGAGLTTISTGPVNFNSGSSITTRLASNGTVAFNTGAPVTLPSLLQTGGTLTGTDTVNISGLFTWSGGTHGSTGITNPTGGLNITGEAAINTGRTLNNTVAGTMSASGNLAIGNGAVFNNLLGATFDIQNNRSIGGGIGGASTVNNAGTMTKSAGGGTTTVNAGFNNTGTLNANDGTFRLASAANPSTSTGAFNVAGGAMLAFDSGTHDLSAASSIAGAGTVEFTGATVNHAGTYNVTSPTNVNGGTVNFTGTVTSVGVLNVSAGTANFSSGEVITPPTLTLSGGTLTGTDTITVPGLLTWTGGTLSGAGITNANGGIALDGGPRYFRGGRTLNNAGVATLTLGSFVSGEGAVFNNLASGTFDAQTGFNFTADLGGASPQFNNAGTFTKSAGGSSVSMEAVFNNTGTASVTASSVSFQGGGNSSGSFTVGTGSGITFYGISHTLTAASSISGAGGVQFAYGGWFNLAGTYNVTGNTNVTGGLVNFTGTVTSTGKLWVQTNGSASFNTPAPATVQEVDFSSGGLGAEGTVNITGPMNFSNGTLSGSGTMNVGGLFTWRGGSMSGSGITNANGGMTLDSGPVTLTSERTLNNSGTATWTAGNINSGQGAVFNNLASGTFDIQVDAALVYNQGGTATQFNNAGTLTKSAGAGTTTFSGVTFNNTGTLNANSGTLNFTGTFSQTTGLTLLNGGSVGTTTTLTYNGGTLGGTGTITGSLGNSAGLLRPGFTPGTINITGDYTNGASGTVNVELGGLTAGTQYDQITITGSATFAGTLNVTTIGGFTPALGNSFTIMTYASRTGTFSNLNLPALGGGNQWSVLYNPTSLVLTVSPPASADLAVTKTDSPDPVLVGQNLTYTVTVANGGPDPATGVTLTDTLPANVTYVSATPSQGSCSQAAGVVTCPLGTIAASGSATVTIVVTPQVAAVGTITNTASVTAVEADPNGANNSASQNTTVNPVVDLSVTKTDSPDPVRVGNALTYTVTVSNVGLFNATGATLADTLPANVTFGTATPSQGACAQAAGVVTCNLGTINTGASATVTITVTPLAAAAGTITNAASVTAAEADSNLANNSASQGTTVQPVADVSITKTDAPDPVLAGANLTYTLTASNTGPNSATGITLTDTLPANVTYVSATASQGSCAQAAGVVTCNLGTLASAANATAAIVVRPTAAAVPSVSNTASVTATEFDPNAANNSATAATTVNPAADLAVTKTDNPDPVVVGQSLTYTVVVVNNGPSQATGVTLTDTLPAGPAFVSATSTQGSCAQAAGTVTCTIGTMNSGATVTVTIVITPAAAGNLSNTASVTSGVSDPTAGNNSATAATTVNPAIPPGFNLSADPPVLVVSAGLAATYTITVTPTGGFTGNVALTCTGYPELTTCTLTPSSVSITGTAAQTATMVVTTRAGSSMQAMTLPAGPVSGPRLPAWSLWLVALAMALTMAFGWRAGNGRAWPKLAARIATVVLFGILWAGCAAKTGTAPGTAPGTYVITVTGTSGTISRTTTVTLVVR
jgi:uncharacterized repeat protein (TIGR01451 family)